MELWIQLFYLFITLENVTCRSVPHQWMSRTLPKGHPSQVSRGQGHHHTEATGQGHHDRIEEFEADDAGQEVWLEDFSKV